VPAQAQLVYEAGPLEIDSGKRELRARGIPVPIGDRAFEIIQALARSAGELVTKDDLMGRVWPGAVVGEATIQVHISAIRKALGPDRAMLKTTSGRGYRLLGRWTARQADAPEPPIDWAPGRVSADRVQSNLPIAPSVLIGRDAAMRQVRDLTSAYRVVTLTGPGGIGKTRLALEVARGLLPGFDDGAWLVDLASLSDASLVAAAVASVLGLQLGQTDISPEALARTIGRRKLLLVIDNCEHVINAAARMVEALVRLCPMVSVLATSRELLRIDGECTYRLPPLEFPAQDSSDVGHDQILEMSAVRLFIARVATWRSDSQRQDEIAAIAAICRRLDGIPLAIEFAAARAAALGVEEVLARLDDRFTLLTTGRRTALPKHRTLRATLDWSYELLSAPERLLLSRLAIFTGAFSLEAANIVVAIRNDTPADMDITDGVASLVQKSLVTADSTGPAAHFRLLDTTRAYALEKLAASGELPRFAREHAKYYLELLERAEGEGETRPARMADLGNVRAALEWCFGPIGDAEIGIGLATAAARVFLAMSLFTECRRWSERALLALDHPRLGGREEMHLKAALGMSLMYTGGQNEAAREAFARGLEIAEQRRDTVNELRLLSPLYLFHFRLGDLKTALRYVRRMSVISEIIGDPARLAIAHSLLGLALHLSGDLDGADRELEAALRHGPGSRRASTANLGFDGYSIAGVAVARNLWLRGHATQAVERARQTIDNAAGLEHPISLFPVLIWAFSVFHWAGELQIADEHVDGLIARARSYSLGPYLALGRGFRGQLAILRGDAQSGVEALRSCLPELHAARYELLTTPFNISLAQGLAAIGSFGEAMTLIDETIRQVEANEDLVYMPELLRVKANILLSGPRPNRDDAETLFVRSLELSRCQAAPAWQLRTAIDLAALLASQGQRERARALLRPVLDQFTEGSDTADLQAAERLLATFV
jgi:predicted ATPase/DNA-binding winged helix-turn-helix (wHTH) protein